MPASLLLGGAFGFLLLGRHSPRRESDARDCREQGKNQNLLHRILPEASTPDGPNGLAKIVTFTPVMRDEFNPKPS